MPGTLRGMDIEVRAVDPLDEGGLAARHGVATAALAEDIPDFPPPCPVRYGSALRHPSPGTDVRSFLAYADGQPAAVATLWLPLLENTGNARMDLQTAPAYRRRGVGRALHAYAVEVARQRGRVRLRGETVSALPGGVPRDGAGRAFATAMGASEALVEVRRRLDLSTVDIAALPVPEAPGYTVVRWRDRAPDAYLADIGRLDGRMVTDAPQGDLVVEPAEIDAERIRGDEAAAAARGERRYHTGIRHDATGALVAWTTLAFEPTIPDHAWQHITIVDPAHRGHRLGIWSKLANLRYARAREPALRTVDTWNAATNAHMIAINEAIGFRAVDAFTQWQQAI
jgi:GNAT superfamily N-acetyltransferase